MGRIVIVVYRPKPRKEMALQNLVKGHMDILKKEGLVTERKAVIMKASDQSIIEIFEWKSAEAIHSAHSNPEVHKLWARFDEVCSYEKPVNIAEFHNLFSEFEPID